MSLTVDAKTKRKVRVAMIGSRKQEQDSQYLSTIPFCTEVCYKSAELGIVMTSGLCAQGMDAIAQKAYAQAFMDGNSSLSQLEVYVASQYNINKSTLPFKDESIIVNPELDSERDQILQTILTKSHYNRCNPYALSMHKRNIPQILGDTLNNPVDAVLCWTPNGSVVGGTATAIKLAQQNNIPIFNLGSNPTIVSKAYLDYVGALLC